MVHSIDNMNARIEEDISADIVTYIDGASPEFNRALADYCYSRGVRETAV